MDKSRITKEIEGAINELTNLDNDERRFLKEQSRIFDDIKDLVERLNELQHHAESITSTIAEIHQAKNSVTEHMRYLYNKLESDY